MFSVIEKTENSVRFQLIEKTENSVRFQLIEKTENSVRFQLIEKTANFVCFQLIEINRNSVFLVFLLGRRPRYIRNFCHFLSPPLYNHKEFGQFLAII